MQWVQFLHQKDSLEEGMETHSSILAWRIPWIEEPGGLQSTGSQLDTTLRTPTNRRMCSVAVQLCDLGNCSPPGSSVHGVLQARVLEWVAISFSRGSSRPRD